MSSPQIEAITDSLVTLAENAPGKIQEILYDALERIQYVANRTPERDRDSVLYCIRQGITTAADIASETGMHYWLVTHILRDLVRQRIVAYRVSLTGSRHRPPRVYHLIQRQSK